MHRRLVPGGAFGVRLNEETVRESQRRFSLIRVLLVDDHEVVRRGVRSVLAARTDFEVCGEAVDGQDGVEKAKLLRPDVVVMDVSMPKLNGFEATRLIHNLLPDIGVLILSTACTAKVPRPTITRGRTRSI